jgi:O-antigen ligase
MNRFLDRSIALCHPLLVVAAGAFLVLQPTPAVTYGRSLALGVMSYFALVIAIAALAGRTARIPLPGPAILVPLVVWCLWGGASWYWSIDPAYSAVELRREILFGAMTMAAFYVAARDELAWRALIAAVIAGFSVVASVAVVLALNPDGLDVAHWHAGVGPFSTWLVLIAPLLLTLLAPRPGGFGGNRVSVALGIALLALLVGAARIADNRMVWIALSAVFAVSSALAAWRWRSALARAPLRWLVPLVALLVVLGLLFGHTAQQKARAHFPPETSVASTLAADPRLALWEETLERIRARPLAGYGFGKSILAQELRADLHDSTLSHAHNIFISQWLQTGAVGLAAFVVLLGALGWRYVRFLRSADDTLALLGLIGIALIVGFVIKNLTDDFLFRSNGKEFWALSALVLGLGMRRSRNGVP